MGTDVEQASQGGFGTATDDMVPGLRMMLPGLIFGGILPIVAYFLIRPHVSSDAIALMIITVFPVMEIGYQRIRHGEFEPIGIISLVGITIGIIGAVAFGGSVILLKIRESLVTGLFGLICLGSLLLPRPVMFYMGRAFATGGDAERSAEFDQVWEIPDARASFRRITIVWGLALVAEAVFRTGMAFLVPTGVFVAIAPVIGFGVIGALLWYTTVFGRRREAMVREVVEGQVEGQVDEQVGDTADGVTIDLSARHHAPGRTAS
jgi:hypothetical protein